MTQPALIVLRPGDKVLVTLAEDASEEECTRIATHLKRSFRGCDFVVLAGIAGICIQP